MIPHIPFYARKRNGLRRPLHGFTLVELLVVVGIISVLLAILLPALVRARIYAKQTQCAAQLHQWGISLMAYAAESKGRLPQTVNDFGGRYPLVVRVHQTAQGEFAAEIIKPFMPGVDFSGQTISDLWFCPSNSDGDWRDYTLQAWNTYDFFQSAYAYFAHVDDWQSLATQPDQLIDRDFSSTHLLMCDGIFRWWVNGIWSYNHGVGGNPSSHVPGLGIRQDAGPPNIAGVNQLFGDGHVVWKDRGDFNPTKMQSSDPTIGYVRGGSGDETFY